MNHNLNIEMNISDNDIKDIVITALEGGIGYWGCLINEGADFDRFYKNQKGISTSEFVADLLLSGKSVYFYDTDSAFNDSEHWELNLSMLLKGIQKHINQSNDINFMQNLDSVVADNIFQYAMFNELVYG